MENQLQIRLDANGVAAPAQQAAWQCSEIAAFFLHAAGSAGLSKQPETASGVHETLEQALLFIEMVKYQPTQTTWGEFQAHVAEIERRAGRLPFPPLLAEGNGGLPAPRGLGDVFTALR